MCDQNCLEKREHHLLQSPALSLSTSVSLLEIKFKKYMTKPDMRKFLLLFILLVPFGSKSKADEQNRTHNVYVNFFESINIVSVNYDTRFSGNSVLGWHGGIGYIPFDFGGVSLPVGVNAILGRRASKFEIGVTFTPCLSAWKESESVMSIEGNTFHKYTNYYGPIKWKVGFVAGLDIGYRLQRKRGFFFRTGLSVPVVGRNIYINPLAIAFMSLIPYFSFGYTFK